MDKQTLENALIANIDQAIRFWMSWREYMDYLLYKDKAENVAEDYYNSIHV